jgi:hypothetical protein
VVRIAHALDADELHSKLVHLNPRLAECNHDSVLPNHSHGGNLMNVRNIRTLIFGLLIVILAAGSIYVNFSSPQAASLPVAGPMAMESAELEAPSAPGGSAPLTYDVSGPIVGQPVQAVSFDKDLRSLPQIGPAEKKPKLEMPEFNIGESASDGSGPDAVLQDGFGILAMPAPLTSFKGLDLNTWGAGWPPDTNGDVGPNHYIQTVNTSIGIYDKTGVRLAAFTFNTLFDGTGTPCDTQNNGDPVVLYDSVSGRWIITDFAWNTTRGPFYECIAVSKTADPVSGGWWFYALVADNTNLNDYPKLGVWSDGIYMSANMFRRASTFRGPKVWALNRDDLISGAPLRSVAFTLGTAYASLIPSHMITTVGSPPPSGTPNFFTSIYAPSTVRLWKFTVNWASPGSSTFTGPTNISVASFTRPSTRVPQRGTTVTLDSLGDRLMVQGQYRNIGGVQSLWLNHTVVSNSVFGVRWYEIRNPGGTPSVYQQGTFQPDSSYRWMGSLAVDKQGNMAVGYSVSSSTLYPEIRYAGRLVGDTLGQLAQGETTLIAGTGSQTSYNRWGDYSGMTVDPVDGCTFWYTTEYYETTGTNWQTRIGSFKFPGCTP